MARLKFLKGLLSKLTNKSKIDGQVLFAEDVNNNRAYIYYDTKTNTTDTETKRYKISSAHSDTADMAEQSNKDILDNIIPDTYISSVTSELTTEKFTTTFTKPNRTAEDGVQVTEIPLATSTTIGLFKADDGTGKSSKGAFVEIDTNAKGIIKNATQNKAGVLSAEDKTKLDNIAAFSNVVVGNTILEADEEKDTLTLEAGTNISFEPNANEDKIIINNTYELPVAGDSIIGGVKSGTDITIDEEGNVSVNDDSHNHTIENIDELQNKLDLKLETSLKGANGGLAELDDNGKVPSSQLPSYVDDVLEYSSYSDLVVNGTDETNKIYVTINDNKTYRWSGSNYVEISASLVLGDKESTAFRGDWGQIAYNHASAKGSAFNAGLYKITTNTEGHVTSATAVTKTDITTLGIPSTDVATTSKNGLLSSSDKVKINNLETTYLTQSNFNSTIGNYALSSSLNNYLPLNSANYIKSLSSSGNALTYTTGSGEEGSITLGDSVNLSGTFNSNSYHAWLQLSKDGGNTYGGSIYLPEASQTNSGIITARDQTFDGTKRFTKIFVGDSEKGYISLSRSFDSYDDNSKGIAKEFNIDIITSNGTEYFTFRTPDSSSYNINKTLTFKRNNYSGISSTEYSFYHSGMTTLIPSSQGGSSIEVQSTTGTTTIPGAKIIVSNTPISEGDSLPEGTIYLYYKE